MMNQCWRGWAHHLDQPSVEGFHSGEVTVHRFLRIALPAVLVVAALAALALAVPADLVGPL